MSMLKIKCRNVLSCITKKKKKSYGELLLFSGSLTAFLGVPLFHSVLVLYLSLFGSRRDGTFPTL